MGRNVIFGSSNELMLVTKPLLLELIRVLRPRTSDLATPPAQIKTSSFALGSRGLNMEPRWKEMGKQQIAKLMPMGFLEFRGGNETPKHFKIYEGIVLVQVLLTAIF
ncbi:hypothetical protein Bpfe_025882 [Biomphalaria pfeifferi]|uniref:Uncharacterized protein n=1 Tax=Biomphalaria pfeifferi TaxID=112525 RepID=A0AAD8AZR8_BIOPF|nr:hypothetical protein Bpfe_025882 [Biomphalaria pfeifferi]